MKLSRQILVTALAGLTLTGCSWFDRTPEFRYRVSRLGPEAIRTRAETADSLHVEPRTAERVIRSLDLCTDSISPLDGYAALWRAARACSWLAARHPNVARREEYAALGASIGSESVRLAPDRPEPHYFYALSLGLLSQIQGRGRSRLPLMVENAKRVVELDETYAYAAGHRYLGILYFETRDNLFAAQGTIDDALRHLRRACELAPEYGQNHLALAKALADDDEIDEARSHLRAAINAPPPQDLTREHGEWVEEARRLLEAIGDE